MDDSELEAGGPGPYPAPFSGPHVAMSPTTPGSRHAPSPQAMHGSRPGQYGTMTQLLDSNSNLEWDPFGLSASMAFPNQFAFDQSNLR
ncbi:hypothetical protein IMZ48_04860 [Candidatus Bathyarchaeota archaeon]|nr:hypothetical protein [Candidatus Bathyarchaeota archaeon]